MSLSPITTLYHPIDVFIISYKHFTSQKIRSNQLVVFSEENFLYWSEGTAYNFDTLTRGRLDSAVPDAKSSASYVASAKVQS